MFGRRPDAVRVIPGLWMGSAASIRNGSRLARHGIDCVVDLREEGANVGEWAPHILITHIPRVDHGTPTSEELRDAAAKVSDLVKQGYEVLVHCHAGVERTPTVV